MNNFTDSEKRNLQLYLGDEQVVVSLTDDNASAIGGVVSRISSQYLSLRAPITVNDGEHPGARTVPELQAALIPWSQVKLIWILNEQSDKGTTETADEYKATKPDTTWVGSLATLGEALARLSAVNSSGGK